MILFHSMEEAQDFLGKCLFLYPQKPAMALWRACEAEKAAETLKNIEAKEPSIDLGCGDGEIAKIIFQNKKIDVGLDISYLEIEKAKECGLYSRLIVSDIYDNRLADRSFRFIFSNSVIEHLTNLEKGLREIARISAEKAIFILAVPTDKLLKNTFPHALLGNTRFKKIAINYGQKRNLRLGHHLARSFGDWKEAIEDRGFKVSDEITYLSPGTTRFWDALSYLDFLLRITCVDRVIMKFPKAAKLLLVRFWKLLLKRVYTKEKSRNFNDGSCSLIIAVKR